MNITTRAALLAQELRLLTKITPNKTTIPALAYIHLIAGDGTLTLETTDMTLALRTTCPITTHEAGSTTLPAKKTLELLEQLPDLDVNIAIDDRGQALITAGTFKSRLQTMSVADFPSLPSIEGEIVTLPAVVVLSLIERSAYAISDKPQKYVLDGALFSLNGPVMAMVASDGKRLTVVTAARPDGPLMNVLIPRKTLELLTAFLSDGDVEISFSERHLFFATGPRVLISRTLDGQFPKYDKIIPRDCNKHLTLDRVTLAAALRRVAVIADEHQSVVFHVEPGMLRLTSQSAGIGDAFESVPASYDGEPLRVVTIGKHVIDFLDRATEKNVTLALKTAESPMLWTDGSDFLNVILVRKS